MSLHWSSGTFLNRKHIFSMCITQIAYCIILYVDYAKYYCIVMYCTRTAHEKRTRMRIVLRGPAGRRGLSPLSGRGGICGRGAYSLSPRNAMAVGELDPWV